MSGQDKDELIHEHHVFYDDIEPTKDQDIIVWLKSENAYLRGKIAVYENFLKNEGYIKEEK